MPTVAVRRALLTGTRSFPFRDWKVAPKLPQFPGWSPIPPYKRIFTEFLDEAGIETAYVTDNPFLVGPRFERFRGTLDTVKPIYDQAEYRVWNIGVDKDKVASRAQIENYLLPALQGTEAEERIKENVGFNRGRKGDQLSGAQHPEGRDGGAEAAEGQAALLPRRGRLRPARGVERADRVQAPLPAPRGRRADPALQDAQLEGRVARRDRGADRAGARAVRRRAHLHRRVDRPPAEPARRPGARGQHRRLLPVGPRDPARRARPAGQGRLDARQGDPLRAVHDPAPRRASERASERLLRLDARRGADDPVLPGPHRARARWRARTSP